jgi:hypothetical protein
MGMKNPLNSLVLCKPGKWPYSTANVSNELNNNRLISKKKMLQVVMLHRTRYLRKMPNFFRQYIIEIIDGV